MYYSKELPLVFKRESISFGAGWLWNDSLFYGWNSQIPFFIGFKISKHVSVSLYLGLWYLSISM